MAKKPPVKTASIPVTVKPVAARSVAAPSAPSPVVTKKPAPVLTQAQISKRAYEIWERRGRPVGRDADNWKDAERELKAELGIR